MAELTIALLALLLIRHCLSLRIPTRYPLAMPNGGQRNRVTVYRDGPIVPLD